MSRVWSLLKGAVFFVCAALFTLSEAASTGDPPTVAPATYKLLERVDKLIEQSAYQDALSQLNAMLGEVNKNSLDQAAILRSIASVYSHQGNYGEAAKALEKSLDTQALPEDQAGPARWNLGELYAAAQQFGKAANLLASGLRFVKSPGSQEYYLLANVFAQIKQYEKAAEYLRKAIAGKQQADEAWYKMLLAMLYETGNYREGVKVLDQLIAKFPSNKEYWLQLIAMYQQMNQYQQALAVNEMAYREGLISGAEEILNLADLMAHQNAPYRAAELLEKEIASDRLANNSTNWEKVANAWSQAREFDRAVSALKKASQSSPSGELDFRAAQIYIEQEKWKDAREELLEALRKGGLRDTGSAHLLHGISCYELHFNQQARDSFIRAQQYSNTRDSGRQWADYIASEG